MSCNVQIDRSDLDWPLTLAGWDRRKREATNCIGQYAQRELYAHPILFMDLAMELGLYSMLPAAF
jgi:hypothetical protein